MDSVLFLLTNSKGKRMSRIALAIAPITNATLSVLGVTASEIVLAGQDGKTQSVKLGEYPELDKAKAGDVVTLEVSDTANTYLIKAIETPKALGETAASASRPCNRPMREEYRQ